MEGAVGVGHTVKTRCVGVEDIAIWINGRRIFQGGETTRAEAWCHKCAFCVWITESIEKKVLGKDIRNVPTKTSIAYRLF